MVPFGSLPTDWDVGVVFHRPLCEWRRETAWSIGTLVEFAIAVCWGGRESLL